MEIYMVQLAGEKQRFGLFSGKLVQRDAQLDPAVFESAFGSVVRGVPDVNSRSRPS